MSEPIKRSLDDEMIQAFAAWWNEHGEFCETGGVARDRIIASEAWRYLYPTLIDLRRENEELREENAKLSGPEQTITVCEKGKPFSFMAQDPCRYSLCEVTYAQPVYRLIEERDQLREKLKQLGE